MSTATKVILAIATALPVLYLALFVTLVLYAAFGASPRLLVPFPVLAAAHVLVIVWVIGLEVVYIRDVFGNRRVSPEHKPAWIALLVAFNMLAMPVYWYLFVRGSGDSVSGDGGAVPI